MKIEKIYEDEDILILDKPCGLIVNNSQTSKGKTLQDYLEEEYKLLEKFPGTEFAQRAGIVHRLDKETSGLLVVAKNPESFLFLQKEFKGRNVRKEYTAVVFGRVQDEKIQVNAPIGRNPKNRIKFALVPSGKEAITDAEKLEELNLDGDLFTVLKVFPKTGRTHQIRVHMAGINHPIAGDSVYSTSQQQRVAAKHFQRLMLHASSISFLHPKRKEEMFFTSSVPF
jgi:23S rRNA pseudouridine1911/1915/1917 synthase